MLLSVSCDVCTLLVGCSACLQDSDVHVHEPSQAEIGNAHEPADLKACRHSKYMQLAWVLTASQALACDTPL